MTNQPHNLADAVELLGFAGELVPDVRYAASSCAVIVQLDTEEVQRRETAGLGALASTGRHLRLLDTLFDLPFGEPVPWSAISPLAQVELDCAPPGVLEHGPHQVTRQWRPAVTVRGVLVVAHDNSRRGLVRVGLHAWLPRGLVTMRRPRPSSMLPFEASAWSFRSGRPGGSCYWRRKRLDETGSAFSSGGSLRRSMPPGGGRTSCPPTATPKGLNCTRQANGG
jgi:hypothetical protein